MMIEKIAHRGLAAIAPENTLAAFETAVNQGANAVEFDVQLSLDKVPILIHDLTLERTTNGQGLVKNYPLTDLKKLDAGQWFAQEFTGQFIPTFEEVLDYLAPTKLKIYPEIKDTNNWTDQDIQNLINIIQSKNYHSRCTIISFDALFLQKVNQLDKRINLGYNSANISDYQTSFKLALNSQNPLLLLEYHLLLENPQILAECKANQIKIIAWTVDDPKAQQDLINQEIQGIISNYPLK